MAIDEKAVARTPVAVATPPDTSAAGASEKSTEWRYDLLRFSLLRRIVKHRAFQPVLNIVNLFFFTLVILTGVIGTEVGNKNFSIIFVWIVWWALLILLLIPLGARIWCTTCPIPVLGEWMQRRAIVMRRAGKLFTLGLPWPRRLRNIWLQNFAFVGVAMFSAVILTRPSVTGFLLLGFIVIALGLSATFERRVFCRYVCPVGGFIGLYSLAAPLEIRVKDPEVCLRHCGKECARGSAAGHGCPWMEYPGSLARNAYCGMCTECIKNCPTGNVAINVRPFGADLLTRVRHLDEAYKGFIMLAAALLYSTVMLGPWGWLKSAAYLGNGNPGHYLAYVGSLLSLVLLVMPGAFLATAALSWLIVGERRVSIRRLWAAYGYTSVPLGLMGWIAFSLSFVFINSSYALAVISDPFGWGWNLFGTAGYPWTPYVPQVLPYLQVPILLGGLAISIKLASRIGREQLGNARRVELALLPQAALLMVITGLFLRLYLG